MQIFERYLTKFKKIHFQIWKYIRTFATEIINLIYNNMCFCVYKDNATIADRDIKCYKCLQSDLTSPCFDFQYKLGKKYNSIITTQERDDTWKIKSVVTKGFHSYISMKTAEKRAHTTKWYNNKHLCSEVRTPIVVECIIPKGSTFLTNGIEYVSNNIEVVKIVYDTRYNNNILDTQL